MSTKGISIIEPTKNGGNGGFKTSFFAGIIYSCPVIILEILTLNPVVCEYQRRN
jgi:hypothetical protein